MMAGPRVYYDLMSQPSRALILFLKLAKIPYVDNVLALRKGEHRQEEYGRINPFHLVPAIDDNGFILTESIAIMKYLHAKYKVADHWYPADLKKRARVDEYLSWYHLNTRIKAAAIFYEKVNLPHATNMPIDQEKLRMNEAMLEVSLDQLETVFLKDRNYLAGDDITIADIMAVCEVVQAWASGFDIHKNRPHLTAWLARTKERLLPEFDEVHGPVKRLFAVFNPKDKAKL